MHKMFYINNTSSTQLELGALITWTYDPWTLDVQSKSTRSIHETLKTQGGSDIESRVVTVASLHKTCTVVKRPFYVSDLWGKVSLCRLLQVDHQTQTSDITSSKHGRRRTSNQSTRERLGRAERHPWRLGGRPRPKSRSESTQHQTRAAKANHTKERRSSSPRSRT
jgi:hypothetical protein